jgi:COMPASS component SWD3
LKTIYAEGNPAVGHVSFAPNGRYVLGGTLDSKIRLWDVVGRVGNERENKTNESGQRTGKCSKTYSGHTNKRFCVFLAFSVANPNRQSVVSGSEDGKVYIYDLQSREIQQTLEGHSDAVLAVDAHKSLELIASGGMSSDNTVRFWVPKTTTLKHNDS